MKIAILGASGRTGRFIAEQALRDGHSIRVLARTPAKLGFTHERCEVVTGDATDPACVRKVAEGCDVVISALGPTPERQDVCSTVAAHVVAAGVKRYVAISGAGLDVPGDEKDLVGKIVSFVVKKLTPAIFHDKVREHALLAASAVQWTLVRPPRLVDRPPTGTPRSSLQRAPGSSVGREDLARFTLACAFDDSLIGKAPFVAN